MTQQVHVGPTAQKVLEHLKQHRGMPFAPSDICEVVECSTGQAEIALEALAEAGLVERRAGAVGANTYVVKK